MKRKSFTVAVTGFGPYREYDYNNSAFVRDGTPSQISRKDKLPINIIKYPNDINCIYTELLDLIPDLWSGKRSVYEPGSVSDKTLNVDLMLHIGMHPDDDVYFLEKSARREKYEHLGEDGKPLSRNIFKGQPKKLLGGFDVEDVASKVRQSLPDDISVQTSNDAGLYFCELISYLSLATLHNRKEFGRVIFLHVPALKTEDSIERGVKVATALITQCVDSLPSDYALPT